MDDKKWKTAGLGVLLSAGYCAAFLLLWRVSLDQWYLPAGLRLGCLLLLPMRYWPYVFAGDAAALLTLRIPKAEQYSEQWAYLSPFLFIPAYSLVPLLFRKRLRSISEITFHFPLISFCAVTWTTVVGMSLNYFLMGPRQDITIQNIIKFPIGDYLGAMMITLPALIWLNRTEWASRSSQALLNVGLAALMISTLYGSSLLVDASGQAMQLIPLMAMLVPASYLMVMQRWHGAALGVLMVNAAMALALPKTNFPGAHDQIILLAQTALAIVSAVLLVIGSYISRLSGKDTSELVEELIQNRLAQHKLQEADRSVSFLKATVLSTEQQLREKAILLASAGKDLTEFRDEVARALREQRQSERAMQVMAAGMQSAKMLERQSGNLYPFKIELPMGLYEVLAGPTFLDVWEPRAKVYQRLRGSTPRALSVPLRLSVYRSVERAFEALAVYAPSEYDMSVQVWCRRGRCGVIVDVRCTPTRDAEDAGDAMADCLQELELRALMYDGTLKRRGPHRLSFLMSEPEGEVQAWASPGDAQAAGPTADA